MLTCLTQLRELGTTEGFSELVSFQEFEQIIQVPKYKKLEQQFSSVKNNES